MEQSGIYEIRNILNGKTYVGSTINFKQRHSQHFRQLARDAHPNVHLQRAYNKYGKDVFQFNKLLHCAQKDLTVLEQTMMDANKPEYNMFKFARSSRGNKNRLGKKHTEEAKRKMSIAGKGRKHTKETRKKMSLSRLGHKHSEETRRKLSKAALANKNHAFRFHPGHEVSEEVRRKLSIANKGNKNCLGHKHTEETKRKISLAQKDRPPPSEESRKKMSLAHMGKTLSEEHKAKISEAHKANKNHPTRFRPGQEFSEEWRHKNSQRAKKRERDSLGRFK